MYTEEIRISVIPGAMFNIINVSQYDVGVRNFHFIPYTTEGDLEYLEECAVTLEATKPDMSIIVHNCTYNTDGSIDYTLQDQITAVPGRVWSKLVIRDMYGSVMATAPIVWVVDRAGVYDPSRLSESDIAALHEFLQEFGDINALRANVHTLWLTVGKAFSAATAAEMTDQKKVYVYTGSETGYNTGHWYWWNGSAWEDGGVYQAAAVQTDKELTSEDVAADAKAVGDALALKQNTLTFDQAPTAGSTNPVTSDGLKTALDGKQGTLTFDATPTANSTNPVTSGGVAAADAQIANSVAELKNDFNDLDLIKVTGKNILVTQPTRGFTFSFDQSKATYCKRGQTYAYSFASVDNATTWRTTLNVWDLNGNKIEETDSTVGAQNAFSVVPSWFFASGINYNDVYYTESGNGTYKTFIFTFNQDCYVQFGFYFGNTGDTTVVQEAQLELGNAPTSYEPYSVEMHIADVVRIDDVLSDISDKIYSDAASTTQTGKYIPNTGVITDISNNNYIVISVAVSEGEEYRVIGQAYKNSYYYAFYDSSNAFISGLQATAAGTTSVETSVTVPANAVTLAVAASSIVPHALIPTGYGVKHLYKWLNKKWSAIGDSLTEVNDKTSKNYCDYIAEDTGISVNNMGLSGSGYMRKHDTSHAFYNRVSSLPIDCDVVTIFGSLNDLGDGQQLGTVDDALSDGTVFGYVNATLDALYTRLPTANIGIISPTPWKSSEPWNTENNSTKYCDGLKQICYNRGIPFLDLYHCSNLRPWDAVARDLFYSHDVVDGVNAGCHPDEAGHKMIAPKVKNFLESLLM